MSGRHGATVTNYECRLRIHIMLPFDIIKVILGPVRTGLYCKRIILFEGHGGLFMVAKNLFNTPNNF